MDCDACLDLDVAIDWSSDDEQDDGNPVIGSSNLNKLGGQIKTSSEEENSCSRVGNVVDNFIQMGFPERMVSEAIQQNGEENTELILETLLKCSEQSSVGSSGSKLMDRFTEMGFSAEMVAKAIAENGEEDINSVAESLVLYSAIKNPPADALHRDPECCSSEYEEDMLHDFSDDSENELGLDDSTLFFLRRMGYSEAEASIAIERCGPDASVSELTDFICAAQIAMVDDAFFAEEEESKPKKRSVKGDHMWTRKKMRREIGDNETIRLPNPMIGFGLPTNSLVLTHRSLPQEAIGPPYFYYENVACAPEGVWQSISRFLYDVEPEFVDSKYFCASARKRGYVHNLPIHNRFPILPLPPTTIHEALPLTKRWWPAWDTRTKFNCLLTCTASSRVTDRILKAIENCDGDPPLSVQNEVLHVCRKWNLVWVGRNKVAPLEPDEIEMLLGFPKNHTRGGGSCRSSRFKALGNSFQIDTVAYHLSTLKELFPGGINLLSLFSGIGGAEVALHRLGIPLKNVVSVEICETNRAIMRCWWEQTDQKGNLIHIEDVQQLDATRIQELMNIYGSFDLVIGGSPCNNLTGSNRYHRDGLQGTESSLFYDYVRILDAVKTLIARKP